MMNPNTKTTPGYYKGVQGRVEIDTSLHEVIFSTVVAGTPVSTTRMGIFQAYELARFIVQFVESTKTQVERETDAD